MPTNSGTLAVVSSSNGNINITDVSTLSAVLSGKLDATNEALGVVISEDPSIIANLFETITVDYIQTADQSASTIPDGCFGRKGSDPYFGEVPLLNSKTAFVSDVITSTGSPSRILVGSIPISAEEMQQGYALLNINLMAAIAGSTRDFAIWFDFQEGTGDTTGFAIVLVPTGNSHYLFNGRIYFSADGLGKIALNILSAGPSYIHSGGASQCAIFDDWFDPAYGSPTYLADENEANAIKIYITDISATALDTCNVEGSVSFRKL
jgi:hypothetical protein